MKESVMPAADRLEAGKTYTLPFKDGHLDVRVSKSSDSPVIDIEYTPKRGWNGEPIDKQEQRIRVEYNPYREEIQCGCVE